jgi:hypothetical protein
MNSGVQKKDDGAEVQQSTQTSMSIQINQSGIAVDVAAVARFVFNENFPKVQEVARAAAWQRVSAFIAELDQKLSHNVPAEQLKKFETPEIQHALNEAVQAAALKDDAGLRSILAKLLCERVKTDSDLSAIVYTGAISTVSKLTPSMLNILAFVLLVTHRSAFTLTSWSDTRLLFTTAFNPLLEFDVSNSSFDHLMYCGCGRVGGTLLADFTEFVFHFRQKASKLFQRGYDKATLTQRHSVPVELIDDYFEPNGTDGQVRFKFSSQNEFEVFYKTSRSPAIGHLRQFYDGAFGSPSESRQTLLKNAPEYEAAIKKWRSSGLLSDFHTTSVGFIIGRTHLESMTGISLPNDFEPEFERKSNLSTWRP